MNTVDLLGQAGNGPVSGSAATNPAVQLFGKWVSELSFGGIGKPELEVLQNAKLEAIDPDQAIRRIAEVCSNGAEATAIIGRLPLSFHADDSGRIQFEIRENAKLTKKHVEYAINNYGPAPAPVKPVPGPADEVEEVDQETEAIVEVEEPENEPDGHIEIMEQEYDPTLDQTGEEE